MPFQAATLDMDEGTVRGRHNLEASQGSAKKEQLPEHSLCSLPRAQAEGAWFGGCAWSDLSSTVFLTFLGFLLFC